jgi:hypothetical protein
VNSEELEQSLKAEFESYLKGFVADMREEVNEFQKKIESELENHRLQLDEAFRGFSTRFETAPEFDGGFKESVIEHLRLARDDGAKITASAIAEAEELEKASTPVVDLYDIKAAIDDISTKDSQSSILRSLIQHASKYTPRGAFFIVKNEHFVGWKTFGNEVGEDESSVRDIHFPTSADSVLGGAIKALATVEGSFGTYSEDSMFLDPLHFGRPDRMYAIPLVARGRGVAVLYSDYGHEGVTVNTDVLEMLVRVAGLTVELLASSKAAQAESQAHVAADFSETPREVYGTPANEADEYQSFTPAVETGYEAEEPAVSFAEPAEEIEQSAVSFEEPVEEIEQSAVSFEEPADEVEQSAVSFEEPVEEVEQSVVSFEEPVEEVEQSAVTFEEPVEEVEQSAAAFEETESYPAFAEQYTEPEETASPFAEPVVEANVSDFDFKPSFDSAPEYMHEASEPEVTSTPSFETAEFESTLPVIDTGAEMVSPPLDDMHLSDALRSYQPEETEVDEAPVTEPAIVFDSTPAVETAGFDASPFDQPVGMPSGGPVPATAAPLVEAVAANAAGTRLSDRNVDLPIEVADDERRLHNDARRFARLLVSEIKLYNEKRVQEGREASDLYERLREAIDRSREMYDKRVQPPVAAKFDYFHYELVNSLAEGDEARLGSGYQGAKV